MESGPEDDKLATHAAPSGSDVRGRDGARRPPSGDGALLAELADLDFSLQERGVAWHELARRLDALRREIVVTSTQAQRSRSLAARRALRDQDGGQEAPPPAPTRDAASAARLTHEFEAALRETEERRVALHAEMEALRRRRQDLLARLPAPISQAYKGLTDAGRTPAVATVLSGACGGCQAPLPASVVEILDQGAVVACARCERLLLPLGGAK